MSLRPSVAEQSVRDPSGVGPFFAVFDFSFSMLIHQFVAFLGILRAAPGAALLPPSAAAARGALIPWEENLGAVSYMPISVAVA